MRFPVLLWSLLLPSIALHGVCAAAQPLESKTAVDGTEQAFDYDTALKISQDAIDNLVADYAFTNADGKQVK